MEVNSLLYSLLATVATFYVALMCAVVVHELGHLFAVLVARCSTKNINLGVGSTLVRYKKITMNAIPLAGSLEYAHPAGDTPGHVSGFVAGMGIVASMATGVGAIVLYSYVGYELLVYIGIVQIMLGLGNLIPFPGSDGRIIINSLWAEKEF